MTGPSPVVGCCSGLFNLNFSFLNMRIKQRWAGPAT